VYAGSYQTLYKSLDQGITWQPLITFNGITQVELDCVYVNKLNYIFTSPTSNATSDELGLWRSIDGGAHWVTVYYDSNARHIHCITVDPANNYVYASIGDVRAPPLMVLPGSTGTLTT
jgi:photosystem II stability/assembly factor-like uncharacterized protein